MPASKLQLPEHLPRELSELVNQYNELTYQPTDNNDHLQKLFLLHTLRLWNVAAVTTPQELNETVFPKMDVTSNAICSFYFKGAAITVPKCFLMPYPGLTDTQTEILSIVKEREFPDAPKTQKRRESSSVTITRSLSKSGTAHDELTEENEAEIEVVNENPQGTTARQAAGTTNFVSTTNFTGDTSTAERPKAPTLTAIFNFDTTNVKRPCTDIATTVARGNSPR